MPNALKSLFLLLCLVMALPSIGHSNVSTEEVMDKLQSRYHDVNDITIDFTQKSSVEGFGEKVFEGKLYIKKPKMMRWDYLKPVKQNIFITGEKVLLYMPGQRQAIVQNVSDHTDAEPAMGLLSNIEKWVDMFSIKGEDETGDSFRVELRPKTMLLVEKVLVDINKETFNISSMTLFEKSGNKVSFSFSKTKINSGLEDSLFDFKIPKGTEMLEY